MFCLDTYALVEIALGNEKFTKYSDNRFVIPDLILAEFYAVQLRVHNEATADYWYRKLSAYSVSVPKEVLIECVKFRYSNKEKNLSFFDAVGYVFAKRNGLLFVTGDKAFEDLPGVEFVVK
ncbi:PIN domain-containing protein [Candidatus Woesearchaeota archaeon]|nr:PIN domain-containing protein [Candidatus Woesearchaeota archaeon]